jgi:hypothetical protein
MTGMDMLLASLTHNQLVERLRDDVREANAELMQAMEALDAGYMRWLIEDLEKRIGE